MSPESRKPVRLPPALSRISSTGGGLPREAVRESQRARILAAALTLFGTDGFPETTVPRLMREAGTSQTTFYAIFPDKARCFAAVYDLALGRLEDAGRSAAAGVEGWPLQVRAAITGVLEVLASDPRLARICVVEVARAGPAVDARRRRPACLVAAALRRGRARRPEAAGLPDLAEPALLGGAGAAIASAIGRGEVESLGRLAPDLCECLLAPYLGPAEARRVARGSGRRAGAGGSPADPSPDRP